MDWVGLAQVGAQTASTAASWLDGGHAARKTARAQNELNKDFAKWNMDNIAMPAFEAENAEYQRRWEQDAEYNSPAAQAERMKEAGFYPTGEGFQAGGESVQGIQSHNAQPTDLASIMQAVQSKRQTDLQALALQSQIAKTNAETENIKENTKTSMTFNKFAEALYSGQVELQNGQISIQGVDKKLKRVQIKEIKKNTEKLDAEIGAVLQNTQESIARIDLMDAQKRKYAFENALMDAQTRAELKRLGLMDAQIAEIRANIRKINYETSGIEIANEIQSIILRATPKNEYYKQKALEHEADIKYYESKDGELRYKGNAAERSLAEDNPYLYNGINVFGFLMSRAGRLLH